MQDLNEDERSRLYRLTYVNISIKELVSSFYTFERDKGFICVKCDAIRATFKHDKDCFVGRLDCILTYADNPTFNKDSFV